MSAPRGKPNRTRSLGELARAIAMRETTVQEILEKGIYTDAALATEYYFILKAIESGSTPKLPSPTALFGAAPISDLTPKGPLHNPTALFGAAPISDLTPKGPLHNPTHR